MLRKTTSAAVLAAAAVSPTWAQSASEATTPEVENATTSNSLSTVTVTVNVAPVQTPVKGVTVYVAVAIAVVTFVNV